MQEGKGGGAVRRDKCTEYQKKKRQKSRSEATKYNFNLEYVVCMLKTFPIGVLEK